MLIIDLLFLVQAPFSAPQNEFSIVSRKIDRLSTVQIKHSMGFVLFLIFSGKLRHFQRRWVGDSNTPQAVQSCPCRAQAWAQQSVQSTQAMFVEASESRVNSP